MSLTKHTGIDKIEIVGPYKAVQIRESTAIFENGVMIGQPQYRRYVISAGDDYSSQPQDVRAICATVHTPAVVAAYQSSLVAGAL